MAVKEPPGEFDVEDDVAVGVHRLEHQQLGHDVVGRGVVDLDARKMMRILEELRVRVLALVAVAVRSSKLGRM
jgi:hypothetical protein